MHQVGGAHSDSNSSVYMSICILKDIFRCLQLIQKSIFHAEIFQDWAQLEDDLSDSLKLSKVGSVVFK